MTRTHVIGAAATAALLYAARRYYRNWGTTKDECHQRLPGDELVRPPVLQSTEGIVIDAPVDAVWPLLAQLGQDRAGFYTYQALANLFRPDHHDDHTVGPERQQLTPGDPVALTPPGRLGRRDGVLLRVIQVRDKRSIVLRGTPPEFPWDAVWSFHLEPHWEHQSRLLVRTRAGLRHPGQVFVTEMAGPVVTLTVRNMLQGIKARAEAAADAPHATSTKPDGDHSGVGAVAGPRPQQE